MDIVNGRISRFSEGNLSHGSKYNKNCRVICINQHSISGIISSYHKCRDYNVKKRYKRYKILQGICKDRCINSNKNSNKMNALQGTDYIIGLFGNDYLIGFNGTDTIVGGAGNDVMYGGGEKDALMGSTGNDNITGGYGADEVIWRRR